jgi:branched-chain amino acid transport system ATP-binding protein
VLSLQGVNVHYGVIHAVENLQMEVYEGEIVTLIGANGAGKSTTLRAISGLVHTSRGHIRLRGEEITRKKPHEIVRAGVSQSPEGRRIFPQMSVTENLEIGAYTRSDRAEVAADIDRTFGRFPKLRERRFQAAGTLSGGEQQMLAIGRALMSKPKFLMMDEPSLGIAPLLVKTIFEKIVEINRERRITILLVEQNANLALGISNYGYVLETGRIILHESSAALRQNPEVRSAYLGG